MAPLTKNEKKTSLLPITVINRFEKEYGTIRGGGGKSPRLVCPKKKKSLKKKQQQ
jgi:hypothetical protein